MDEIAVLALVSTEELARRHLCLHPGTAVRASALQAVGATTSARGASVFKISLMRGSRESEHVFKQHQWMKFSGSPGVKPTAWKPNSSKSVVSNGCWRVVSILPPSLMARRTKS
jgi:hypothetical protein